MSKGSVERTGRGARAPSLADVLAELENHPVIYEDDSIRVVPVSVVSGSIERPDHCWVPSVFVVGFYKVLSADAIEGASASCAHDPDVTTLRETGAEVAIGWPDVLETWKDMPFASVAERSFVMRRLAIKVHASIVRVAGTDRVRGKMKNSESFAFSAFGINIYEACGDKWLIVHHHQSKAAERLTS